MNEDPSPFDVEPDEEVTPDDLAVLQAFDTMGDWNTEHVGPLDMPTLLDDEQATHDDDDDTSEMLMLFASEADEDIAVMRRALNQLEQDDHIEPARFLTLRRAAHKLRGTAGAMECNVLADIAHYIELITEQIIQGIIFPLIGVNALVQSVVALEVTLKDIVTHGQEHQESLTTLQEELEKLNIVLEEYPASSTTTAELTNQVAELPDEEGIPIRLESRIDPDSSSLTPFVRVDARRFERLMLHTEQLAELRTPLESAQAEVDDALQALHGAQTRLHQLETALSSSLATEKRPDMGDGHPTSSLIARILQEATPHNDTTHIRKVKPRPRLVKMPAALPWDELELEHYTERDLLIRALNEAIADVNVTTSRVRIAFSHLNTLLQQYTNQASGVRSEMLRLRLAPLSRLLPRLQRAVAMSTATYKKGVEFEVMGETTEVDQDILEALAHLLLQLLRTCIVDSFTTQEEGEQDKPYRIWLRARGVGNEITIEVGFSMKVQGGGLDAVSESIRRLKGSISLQRNSAGGISFYLRLPRSQGAVRSLLIRVGTQYVIVPFSQVLRIVDKNRENFATLYYLDDLLGFPRPTPTTERVQPVLVPLQEEASEPVGILVDEVVGEVELVVKSLPNYLRRPGIVDAAIDGKGNLLLMVDLPARIDHFQALLRKTPSLTAHSTITNVQQQGEKAPTVLIADDSVFLRHSLSQLLKHANYVVMEARDGMEALELMLDNPPDVFLVDVEMPNLNGYDLLSIMGLYSDLAHTKIIMLTSRSSDKHKQRAHDLGVHAYLTKPCPSETLLETIEGLLKEAKPMQ